MSATATAETDWPADFIAAEALALARQRQRPASPAALGKRVVPGYQITPTIALVSDVLADAIANPDRRYCLSCPPRTGKSVQASIIAPVFALMADPDSSVIVSSYADQLAEEHSREARRIVAERSGLLGFDLAQDKSAVGRWKVAGRRGGMLAGGVLSGTTGFGASALLVVDDPVKGAAEADSPAHRRRLLAEFRASLLSRLHPGASCVVVATRWHPDDLIGTLLADEPDTWTHVNVPAISEAGVLDSLHRPPGQAMVSALGRTADGFAEIKRAVGSRAWAALYLGTPAAPEGNVIRAEWIDSHRLPAAPARPSRIVVAVDPADSGEGDQTGIVAGSLAPDGTVALIADVSEHLTSDAWANRAVELAITLGASSIVVEGFSAATTYVRLVTEALKRQAPPHHVTVSSWPPKGRARVGDALARSAGMLAAMENGGCRIAGHLPDLEAAMTGWQPGAHQPDSVAAAVIAFDTLADAAGQRWQIAAPAGVTDRAASASSGGGGFVARLGSRRELVDAMVADSAARKRAGAAGTETDDQPDEQAARVVSMAGYLSQRVSDGRGYRPLGHAPHGRWP